MVTPSVRTTMTRMGAPGRPALEFLERVPCGDPGYARTRGRGDGQGISLVLVHEGRPGTTTIGALACQCVGVDFAPHRWRPIAVYTFSSEKTGQPGQPGPLGAAGTVGREILPRRAWIVWPDTSDAQSESGHQFRPIGPDGQARHRTLRGDTCHRAVACCHDGSLPQAKGGD
jgi:hypothetical protein